MFLIKMIQFRLTILVFQSNIHYDIQTLQTNHFNKLFQTSILLSI